MKCAMCLLRGDATVAAVTILNGTAACIDHVPEIRRYVNNAGGPPAFALIGDKRLLAFGA